MFTGLVEEIGEIHSIDTMGENVRIQIGAHVVGDDVAIGDSICVNGCCLTVVAVESRGSESLLGFDAVPETLKRTNLGGLSIGSPVNLERSLRPDTRLGGHFVTGHIDCCGKVDEIIEAADWRTIWIRVPATAAVQMAAKGSVAVDGISLTLVEVNHDRFSVALIPHTLSVTTIGRRKVGDQVNIETDLLAKYVQRQLEHRNA